MSRYAMCPECGRRLSVKRRILSGADDKIILATTA